MSRSREEILADVLQSVRLMSDDWEYDAPITEETNLISDLGFQSMDLAILSGSLQSHYDQFLPFPDFFEKITQSGRKDVSIGDWVDFIYEQLNRMPARQPTEEVQA